VSGSHPRGERKSGRSQPLADDIWLAYKKSLRLKLSSLGIENLRKDMVKKEVITNKLAIRDNNVKANHSLKKVSKRTKKEKMRVALEANRLIRKHDLYLDDEALLKATGDVKDKISDYLPSLERQAAVINEALNTPMEKETISWADKHKFLETSLKLKGLLDKDKKEDTINIGLVIQK